MKGYYTHLHMHRDTPFQFKTGQFRLGFHMASIVSCKWLSSIRLLSHKPTHMSRPNANTTIFWKATASQYTLFYKKNSIKTSRFKFGVKRLEWKRRLKKYWWSVKRHLIQNKILNGGSLGRHLLVLIEKENVFRRTDQNLPKYQLRLLAPTWRNTYLWFR